MAYGSPVSPKWKLSFQTTGIMKDPKTPSVAPGAARLPIHSIDIGKMLLQLSKLLLASGCYYMTRELALCLVGNQLKQRQKCACARNKMAQRLERNDQACTGGCEAAESSDRRRRNVVAVVGGPVRCCWRPDATSPCTT